jgi:hypothetical protein
MKRILVGLILAVAVASILGATGQARVAAIPPKGALHVTKECSTYTGLAWSFCTITGSNLAGLNAGSTVLYASPAGATSIDSDVVIYAGKNNVAVGHVTLDFRTATGRITMSGGTGQLSGLRAAAVVTFDPASRLWHWDGTYRFT